ncbi:MAG: hypothetical protein NDJ90_16070, partial [Oligoflexia bacterium]|nr:hypothetical protein [Oligoflexia bacterium]
MGQGRHKNRFFLAVPLVALFALPSLAGTVFMAPEFPTRLEPGESYPESRFGKLPEKPGDRTFARSDGDDTGVTRRPAGLEIGRVKQSETSAPSGVTAPPLPMTLPPEPERDRNAELRLPPAETSVARRGVQEVALIAGDLGYFPKTVFVNRDVPVRLFVTGAS